jgi:hypothetical protein
MNKSIARIVLCLFVLSFASLAIAGHDPEIKCLSAEYVSGDDSDTGQPGTNKKLKNYLDHGQWIRWNIFAPEGTLVTIEFKKKKNYDGTDTLDTSPMEHGLQVLHFLIEKPNGEKVKGGRVRNGIPDGTTYGYSVTCKYADGRPENVIDPMIEVPRPTIIPLPPSPQTQTQSKD